MNQKLMQLTTAASAVIVISFRAFGADIMDPTFRPVSGINAAGAIFALDLAENNRLYIAGSFSAFDGIARNQIARLQPDGTLDTTFDAGQGPNHAVYAVKALPGGRVLIGGAFGRVNTVYCPGIARLRADGSLDLSFKPDFSANGTVTALVCQPDGKIIVAGSQFDLSNAQTKLYRQTVARLNEDGTVDKTFDAGVIWGRLYKGDIAAVALQPNGKLIIAGAFNTIAQKSVFCLARLNSDGSLDTGFSAPPFGPETTHIDKLALQSDGRLLIAGDFATINGYSRIGLARLNADGSLDTSFDAGPSSEPIVRSLALQRDGKVLTSQNRSAVGNYSAYMVRRMPQGNGDPYLGPAIPTRGVAFAMLVQPDGRFLVAGNLQFNRANGTAQLGIARITPLYLLRPQSQPDGRVLIQLVGEPNRHYIVESSENTTQWTRIFDGMSDRDITRIADLPENGHRFYRAKQVDE
jgi:uncharacterized delta-60 repeat protein